MSEAHPSVVALPVHLPDYQPLRFGVEQSVEQILRNPSSIKTMLTEFFVKSARMLPMRMLGA